MKTRSIAFCLLGLTLTSARANPGGMAVQTGSAASQKNGSSLTVTTGTPLTVLKWGSFNIQQGETTTFAEPSASSIVFNVIGGGNASQILGNLNANGSLILVNSQGFIFGPNSKVAVGGDFIAATSPLVSDMGLGSSWQFTGMPPSAAIVNYGQISVGSGHSLYLISENIANSGSLTAPGGEVGLYAGKDVLVSERPDGRGLSAVVKLPAGAVNNNGQIVADAGAIALQAQVVNQEGLLQADSVRDVNGTIELIASQQVNLGANSQILAQGDNSASGSGGGSVTIKSGGNFSDEAGSSMVTAGGANGGNGGNVEVSAEQILSLNSSMNAGAVSGYQAGQFLLDPSSITLGATGSGSAGNGTVNSGDGSGALALNVNTAFANKNFSDITLEATGNITLSANTTWNLSSSTGENTGQLILAAGGNIVFGNNSKIIDANNWSVNLDAGMNFNTGKAQSGTGSIYLNGSSTGTVGGSVQTGAGSISMTAGQDILVGSGAIRTTAGGSIDLNAEAGNINAGTGNGGYIFSVQGYAVSPNAGGIATLAGGDVTLDAGNNIVSTPTVPSGQTPGASGAYGTQPGNVTLIADNQVLGNYTVANGIGTIEAGVQVQNGAVVATPNPTGDVGSALKPVSLSLIKGSWNVWAADDVFISEVRNPNGTFNDNNVTVPSGEFSGNVGSPGVPTRSAFLFDYAANDAANIWAGDGITLEGNNLPRLINENENMPPIYPPILNLTAGAGGVTVNNPIILYPSALGALHITTTDGGSLTGAYQAGSLSGITMSDSGLPGYATFAAGHAVTPLHLRGPNPVTLDISGGINSFNLTVPTYAQITVGGNAYNFGFQGQNLSPSQTTSITVGGSLSYRGDETSVSLPGSLPLALLNAATSGDPSVTQKLIYDASTGTLSFIGPMNAAQLAFLLNPTEVLVNGAGQTVTVPIPLTAAQQAAIQQLYALSQTATLGDTGLSLAGPGKFNIYAQSIDLGVSGGIGVLAPNAALAAISPYGANLQVVDGGSLEMSSSAIANESYLGNISLDVGGALDVGGVLTALGDPNAPHGIYTTGGGSISIFAQNDINVQGSRVAAYNGGNIFIRSAAGDVNAGTGGAGFISMVGVELDPVTGQLILLPSTVTGSGILETTLPGSHSVLGDITVQTPDGSINASSGGILQIALNGSGSRNASIDISAGRDINAGNSGIIGGNLDLQAGGKVNGILVGTGNINVQSQSSVNVTAFGGAGVTISASGSISGTVISGGNVNVSGEAITASVIANSVTATGNTSGASVGVPTANVAKDDSKAAEDAGTALAAQSTASLDDDDKKKKQKPVALVQKTSRVTVVLPTRKNQ